MLLREPTHVLAWLVTGELFRVTLDGATVAQIELPVHVAAKVAPIAVSRIESDIALTNNNITFFVPDASPARELSIKWNSVPLALAYTIPPHFLAFTPTSVEVRSIVNGAFLQALPFQCSHFLLHDDKAKALYVANNVTDAEGSSACSLHRIAYSEERA
eukprot:Opistho-2@56329